MIVTQFVCKLFQFERRKFCALLIARKTLNSFSYVLSCGDRVVQALDQKSNGILPRISESCLQRLTVNFYTCQVVIFVRKSAVRSSNAPFPMESIFLNFSFLSQQYQPDVCVSMINCKMLAYSQTGSSRTLSLLDFEICQNRHNALSSTRKHQLITQIFNLGQHDWCAYFDKRCICSKFSWQVFS